MGNFFTRNWFPLNIIIVLVLAGIAVLIWGLVTNWGKGPHHYSPCPSGQEHCGGEGCIDETTTFCMPDGSTCPQEQVADRHGNPLCCGAGDNKPRVDGNTCKPCDNLKPIACKNSDGFVTCCAGDKCVTGQGCCDGTHNIGKYICGKNCCKEKCCGAPSGSPGATCCAHVGTNFTCDPKTKKCQLPCGKGIWCDSKQDCLEFKPPLRFCSKNPKKLCKENPDNCGDNGTCSLTSFCSDTFQYCDDTKNPCEGEGAQCLGMRGTTANVCRNRSPCSDYTSAYIPQKGPHNTTMCQSRSNKNKNYYCHDTNGPTDLYASVKLTSSSQSCNAADCVNSLQNLKGIDTIDVQKDGQTCTGILDCDKYLDPCPESCPYDDDRCCPDGESACAGNTYKYCDPSSGQCFKGYECNQKDRPGGCTLNNNSSLSEGECNATCNVKIKSGDQVIMAFSNDWATANTPTWHYFKNLAGTGDGSTSIVITPPFDKPGVTEDVIKNIASDSTKPSTILFQGETTLYTKCRGGSSDDKNNPCCGTCKGAPIGSYFWLGGFGFEHKQFNFLFAPKSSSHATWDEEDADDRRQIWRAESMGDEKQYVYDSPYNVYWPDSPTESWWMAWDESWSGTELNLSPLYSGMVGVKIVVKFFKNKSDCKDPNPTTGTCF